VLKRKEIFFCVFFFFWKKWILHLGDFFGKVTFFGKSDF